jgi:pimeloyl-ACP methyl ester carboxylesterase
VKENWLPFHERLAGRARLIAPAHPGCAQTDENQEIDSIEDVVFHYLEVLDSLKLPQFDLVGSCVGGWIAAEIAVRHPERIRKLVLIGATGLFVEGALIGDVFMMAQPERGSSYAGLRKMLFASEHEAQGLRLFPDGLGEIEDELRRYQMLRFGSRIGFKPPYFYNRPLRNRLYRISSPTLIIWGEQDNMVPRAHGETYARLIPNARFEVMKQTGHSVHIEKPEITARLVLDFLAQRRLTD